MKRDPLFGAVFKNGSSFLCVVPSRRGFSVSTDVWLLEMVSLAEEIRHGHGTVEKSARLAEVFLLMHEHIFEGGALPEAWRFPVQAGFHPPTIPPGSPPLDAFDDASLDEDSALDKAFSDVPPSLPTSRRFYPTSVSCMEDLTQMLDGIEIAEECLSGTVL